MDAIHPLVRRAIDVADDLLFPTADATDAVDVVPVSHLDTLAAAGLYGAASEVPQVLHGVIEALAGGCLTTAFVWLQHLGAARLSAHHAFGADLVAGRIRSGVAFAHLRRVGPPALTARRDGDAWLLEGSVPWVTGWHRIDVVLVAASRIDDPASIVWLLVDADESSSLVATRVRLAAVDASSTVSLRFADHRVPAMRVVLAETLTTWRTRDRAALRTNGSVALGHAARTIALLAGDAGELARAHDQRRRALDVAVDPPAVADARAAACELADRAAHALVAREGGSSLTRGRTAERLAREAVFLVVQGQTPDIRAAQLRLLTRA